jgi:hypothetical protein
MLEPNADAPGHGQDDLPLAPNARGFKASQAAFERAVDPDELLPDDERQRLAAQVWGDYLSQRRRGAYVQQSLYDTRQTTAPARQAFRDSFELEVDPAGALPVPERQRRAEAARHAYYQRLSRIGNQAKESKRQQAVPRTPPPIASPSVNPVPTAQSLSFVEKRWKQVLDEAARRLVAGEAVKAISDDLNQRGLRTIKGQPWSTRRLKNALTSGEATRLLGADLAAQVAQTRHKAGEAPVRSYLLTGLAMCGVCGAKMVPRRRDDGIRRYLCNSRISSPGTTHAVVNANELENWVAVSVLARIEKDASRTTQLITGVGEGLRDTWEQLGFQKRVALIRATVEEIKVGTAKRAGAHAFDPSRVHFVWRRRDPRR